MAPPNGVDDYMHMVKSYVERCIKGYMTKEETMDKIWHASNIPNHITAAVWQTLEENNPEFFKEYYLRLDVMRQIKVFNLLLRRQAGLIRNYNCYMNGTTPSAWQAQTPQCYQSFPGSNNGRQPANFPSMVPNMTAMTLPNNSSPPYPFSLINGSSQTGNNIGNIDSMISAPNSNLPCGFPGSSFMHQNYPRDLSSTFLGYENIAQLQSMMLDSTSTFPEIENIPQQSPMMQDISSTVPWNVNIPQPLPMRDDSSLLSSSRNQIAGRYPSMFHAHGYSCTDVYSPMNPQDELQSTLTQQGFGGLATVNSSPSV